MSVPLLTSCVYSLAVVLSVLSPASATPYSLEKEYYGSSFFQVGHDNTTLGDVNWVSAEQAFADSLAYTDSATSHAFIRVDNFTNVVWDNKRNSVRITTNDGFEVGSLWVTDLYHVPHGCSVWPSFWSKAAQWPQGGEIDTLEGVNLQTYNQMTLHTDTGCTQVSPVQTSTMVLGTNCGSDSDAGCTVLDPSSASYGSGFSNAGGGAFVTEFASTGISIWFFPRSQMPTALSNNASTLDSNSFGTPVANWPSTGCNTQEFFQPQQLVFDITLCGELAGANATFAANCTGSCYNNYVISNNTSIYDTAYFEIGYVRVFGVEGTNTVISPSSSMHNAMVKYGSVGVAVLAVAAELGVMLL